MPSESKQARDTQKEYFQGAIQRRRALLTEKGLDKDRLPKDPHLKHLQAKLRKTARRMRALAALEKQEAEMALRKQQKLEGKTEEPPPEAPKESKKDKKKQKAKGGS